MAIIVSASITSFLLFAFFRLFFDDLRDLIEHLKFLFIPDLLSAFRGDYDIDRNSSFKILIYIGLTIGPGLLTYYAIR